MIRSRAPGGAGFTIVELLVVIVVVAILATISVVAYNGIQERARISQATSDISQLHKAILAARINTGQTLFQITGSHCTRCEANPVIYARTLDRIGAASGMNLDGLKAGDPWGNEYQLDENEGESGFADPCRRDSLSVLNHSSVTAGGTFRIPFTLPECL